MMENTEDELEKYLKDSFDDFEVEPSATFWENLEEHLPMPEKDWRRPLYVLILSLLISSIIGWVWFKYSDSEPSIVTNKKVNNVPETIYTDAQKISKSSNTDTKNHQDTNKKIVIDNEQTFTKTIEKLNTNIVENAKNDDNLSKNNQKYEGVINKEKENKAAKQQFTGNNKSFEDKLIDKSDNSNMSKTNDKSTETITLQKQTAKNDKLSKESFKANKSETSNLVNEEITKRNEESIETQERISKKIDLLNYKFSHLAVSFILPRPKFFIVNKPKKTTSKLPLQWAIGTEISNTYQNIKVVNYSELPVLNVNNPAIFASQRRSMQFSVGVIKPTSANANIRINASLITLKQWTDYDTFSGVYKATNLGQNKYEITQVSNNYTDNKTFKYLSLGINRQIFITKTPAFRFFVSGGVEGLLPLGKQSAQYGLMASLGLQQKINEKLYFTLEPNIMYFLNKNTYDANHLMQISPYTVGLKGNLILRK